MDLDPGMVLMVAPILAGEGVLNGLRGEYRRVEDKFLSMSMELKSVNILFDLAGQHGNRIWDEIRSFFSSSDVLTFRLSL